MTDKAIITQRGAADPEAARVAERDEAKKFGLKVEYVLSYGTLISGDAERYPKIETEGFRVKLLPDTNILRIGRYTIDFGRETPEVPAEREVPAELKNKWRHHLVQLIAPPYHEWVQAIEKQGVEVVEPISTYGLYVVGSPGRVSELRSLPFVAWVGPFKPAYRLHPNLEERTGTIKYVSIGIYPQDEVGVVKDALASSKATIIHWTPPPEGYTREYTTAIVALQARSLLKIARLVGVRWLEYVAPEPGLSGERSIMPMIDVNPGGGGPYYQPWLAGVGLSGARVTVAICDSGIDANDLNNTNGHEDLRGRQAVFINYTNNHLITDTNGHGTHVAGIAVGNAATGQVGSGFLLGQGVAPQARYVNQNAMEGPWPPANILCLTRDAVNNGAQVMNNSWEDNSGNGVGYTANSRRFDQSVRDPTEAGVLNPAGADALKPLVIVCAAGNAGSNPGTIAGPHEAKNPIVVGNSDISASAREGVFHKSSRGPACNGQGVCDRRYLPTVVAPGTAVSSARSATCNITSISGPPNQYANQTGTSMAAAHVTGCCALLIEWWRNQHAGVDPSPAMVKALLINGAKDLGDPQVPLACIPNNDQGWGRVSLANILQPPLDHWLFFDQDHQGYAFDGPGQERLIKIRPDNTAHPMRITLVWTDAPGAPGSCPALVNDLDLEVAEVTTGKIYKGNVFAKGYSIPWRDFDHCNNVECVYIQKPGGQYEVRVIGGNIVANARPPFDLIPWQDFALVISNAVLSP